MPQDEVADIIVEFLGGGGKEVPVFLIGFDLMGQDRFQISARIIVPGVDLESDQFTVFPPTQADGVASPTVNQIVEDDFIFIVVINTEAKIVVGKPAAIAVKFARSTGFSHMFTEHEVLF
jgi:hypothetical protein